jgi:hypothetical protein
VHLAARGLAELAHAGGRLGQHPGLLLAEIQTRDALIKQLVVALQIALGDHRRFLVAT